MSGLCSSFRSSIWFNLNLCGYFLVSDSFLMFSVSDVMSLVTEVQLGVFLHPPSWCFVFLDSLLFYFFLGFQSEWVLVVTLKLCFPRQRLFTLSSGVSQPWVVPLFMVSSCARQPMRASSQEDFPPALLHTLASFTCCPLLSF